MAGTPPTPLQVSKINLLLLQFGVVVESFSLDCHWWPSWSEQMFVDLSPRKVTEKTKSMNYGHKRRILGQNIDKFQ